MLSLRWRQFIPNPPFRFRRVIHNAAALAAGGPLRSIMDNVGHGIREARAAKDNTVHSRKRGLAFAAPQSRFPPG
jgi:hypothetical protein